MLTLKFKKDFTLGAIINSILYIILGFLIVIAIWFSLFLYDNFFTTLNRAETILILKSELAVDTLDVPLYEKIKKELSILSPDTTKIFATSTPEKLSNPFLPTP